MLVRASEDNVGEIFRFFITANTQLSHMEGTVGAYLMPDASQRNIQRTTKAVLSSVGTALQVSKALCLPPL
eukprot:5670546-Amphidinium_carterae.2